MTTGAGRAARRRGSTSGAATTSRTAGIYVRISSDPSGERLGVTRQLEDCRAKAAQLAWTVAGVYEDNDVSASNGQRRPAYERLLADVAAGRINAVIVWDLDRLTRRPIEIENFIDLADRHGVALASVGGDVDLSTDNGRMFARIKGAVARAEIERKSARQRRANLQRAEAGQPGGGRRPFGYADDHTTVVDAEAAEIRRAADALISGSSMRSLAADLNARGITTTMGRPWRPTELRRMLVNPRYAGRCVYQGEVIGAGTQAVILDEDIHRAVVAILADPSRHQAGRPRRYLLSGVARCAICEGRLFGVTEGGKGGRYRCESRRHVHVRSEPVDELVLRFVAARLSRPDAAELLAPPDRSEEAAALRSRELSLRARLDGLAAAFAAGEIDRQQLRAGSQRLRSELEQVNESLASLSRDPVLNSLLDADDIDAELRRMAVDDLDRLRMLLATLVTVTVAPPGRGARVFDDRIVDVQWRTGAG